MNTSRDRILNKLKEATRISSELPASPADIDGRIEKGLKSVTPRDSESLLFQFKEELERVSGEFHRIGSVDAAARIISETMGQAGMDRIAVTGEEACQKIAARLKEVEPSIEQIRALELAYPERKERLASVPAALVEAAYAVADIGSVVFLYDESRTSLPHFLSDCIFTVVKQSCLVANQFELFQKLSPDKAKNMVFVTGPSRTADIEKVLILGAHGPRQFVVLMLEE
ncbi:MAG: LUD domain-containing protein [bacterium]